MPGVCAPDFRPFSSTRDLRPRGGPRSRRSSPLRSLSLYHHIHAVARARIGVWWCTRALSGVRARSTDARCRRAVVKKRHTATKREKRWSSSTPPPSRPTLHTGDVHIGMCSRFSSRRLQQGGLYCLPPLPTRDFTTVGVVGAVATREERLRSFTRKKKGEGDATTSTDGGHRPAH